MHKQRETFIVNVEDLVTKINELLKDQTDVCLTLNYWDNEEDARDQIITSSMCVIRGSIEAHIVRSAGYTAGIGFQTSNPFIKKNIRITNDYGKDYRRIKLTVCRNDPMIVLLNNREVLEHIQPLRNALVPSMLPVLKAYARAWIGLCKQNPWSCDGYTGFEQIVNSISDKYWIPENKAIGSANHYNMIMHIHDKYPIFNYKEAE